jgi:hypothetical protein
MRWPILTTTNLLLAFAMILGPSLAAAAQPENLFHNPSFEQGIDGWRVDRDAKTAVRLTIDKARAANGQCCARVDVDTVEGWGTQLGQTLVAPAAGKTYTFAVLAKSIQGTVTVNLDIERGGKPYDRVATGKPVVLTSDKWTELHVTFKPDKSYPQGWFAYLSCRQPHSVYCADMFRLYEGEYVPYEKMAREAMLAAAVSVLDTCTVTGQPLGTKALADRSGWTTIPEDTTDHRFAGDAVMVNDRVAVVLRRGAAGAELYGRGEAGLVLRAVLAPAGSPARLASVSIVDNSPSEATLEASFQSSDGKTRKLRYELATGQLQVGTKAAAGVEALSIEAPCRFVVLPDFFADDIVIDATEMAVPAADLPSENFLLHLLPRGDSIVMAVASNRGRDARVELVGSETKRQVVRSELDYGKEGKIWVAVLEGRKIWHEHNVSGTDAGRIVSLDWTAPFPAQWRVDWRQADGLTASWEMIVQRPTGEFEKQGWFGEAGTVPADRKRWTTVYGRFEYPCWLDCQGRACLQPLKHKAVHFEGPAVIYPINRSRGTSLREHTVVDVVRATFGVGPCEYILDVEAQGAAMKGRATCANRDALKAIYASGQQRARRAEVERSLDEVVIFVKHIRSRIDHYVAFGRELSAYLDEQNKAHPELAAFLGEMKTLAGAIEADFEKRKANIQTPQYVVDLTDKFRREVLDYEGNDALAKCNAITEAIVVVGGNQDELVGECRRDVKVLRQRAGLAMATNPQAAEIAKEIRRRTQESLRNPASYEGPRH